MAGARRRTPGEGSRLLEATREQGLEGIVAKRLDSRYEPGRRAGTWIKIKNTLRQELVIGGWLPGEGRRSKRIGALLMGYFRGGEFVYAGRVGTGFTERTLDDLRARLEPLRREQLAVHGRAEASARGAVRRAAAGGGDRVSRVDRGRRDARAVVQGAARGQVAARGGSSERRGALRPGGEDNSPEALFDEVERLPEGALVVTVDGRELRITNWDKVLFPQAGFTKGDLIAYYTRIAPSVLPHLHDRPLTLKRYPNGVEAPYFYEKQSPSHRPEWVQTARIGDVEYTLAQDRPTLVWLANLADIELHTSLSLAGVARATDDARVRPRPRRAGGARRVLRGRARAERPVRAARARELRQDVRLEGPPGVRPAQRPGHLRRRRSRWRSGSRSCSSSGCPSSSSHG